MVARDFESPADSGSNNVYNYTLIATDDDGNSDSLAVAVTVTDVTESASLSLSGIADSNQAENSAYTSATPSLSGTPIGSVTYTLGGDDAALFTVNSSTGVVEMVARDFESPADSGSNNVYNYTLIATDDDGNSDSLAVAVTVTDVTESASLSLSGIADSNQPENSAYTSATPSLSGTPIGSVTYTLGGDDAALFTVNSSTGVVEMVARDFESPADSGSNNVYNYTLIATDDDANSDSLAVAVTVTDVTESASLTLSGIADSNQPENSAYTSATPSLSGTPIGSVTYTLGGDDATLFTVNSSTGVVEMVARDFESPADSGSNNVYNYTLIATDDDGNSASLAVAVTVTDVTESASLSLSGIADSNQAENSAYTSATPSLSGTPIGSVTYTLGGDDAALFTVNSSTGVVEMVARDFESPADSGSNNVYNYTLIATDDDANSASLAVAVTVTDVTESASLSLSGIADSNQAENSAYTSATPSLSGTPIGSVTYTLGGDDAALFTVNSSTGVVEMVARDFESPADSGSNNVYNYTLIATDDDGNSDSLDVAVTVTDVTESASLTLSGIADSNQPENSAYTSATPSLSGTPIGSVTYTLGGDDAALFTVNSSTGVVEMVARDFESPADSGSNNVYNYTLIATDDDGNSDSLAVAVTVTDVTESASLTLSRNRRFQST